MENTWINPSKKLPELTEPLMGVNSDRPDSMEKVVIIPNYKATVLAYNDEFGVFKAEYKKSGWREVSSLSIRQIPEPLAWMPLPDKPVNAIDVIDVVYETQP